MRTLVHPIWGRKGRYGHCEPLAPPSEGFGITTGSDAGEPGDARLPHDA